MIPDEEIERVREAADIVAIIGEYVNLRRVGADYRGPCPFHQGTHRNFSVSARRNSYHCFVCGEKGDVFSFVRKQLGLDWPGAVRLVAQKSGIEVREVARAQNGPDPREPVWEINAAAEEYFRRMLWEDALGEAARAYLAERNVDRDLAERFGLGFAPREIGLMRAHLATLGYDDQRLLEAGLLVKREDADEPRPRFRSRLMFPIRDGGGHLAGFGGRLLGPGEPKYLNSADSPAFNKGRLLYGMHAARHAIRKAERVLLVEGYFDVIRLVAAGVEETVAPLGTALTTEQAELLARLSRNVFLLYDSDKAGLRATFRAGDELLRNGASVRVVTLPAGEDPDTFVAKEGREALERHLAGALDVFERKVQLLQRSGRFADLHRRREAIDRLLPTIRAASDPVTRDLYVGRAAEAAGIDRAVLQGEVEGGAGAPGRRQGARRASSPSTPPPPAPRRKAETATRQPAKAVPGGAAERALVHAMLQHRALIEHVVERLGPEEFRDPRYREIVQALMRVGPDAMADELAAVLSTEATAVLDRLSAEPDAIANVDATVRDSLIRLELRRFQERNQEIQRLLTAARPEEADALVREKQQNSEEIRRLNDQRSTA